MSDKMHPSSGSEKPVTAASVYLCRAFSCKSLSKPANCDSIEAASWGCESDGRVCWLDDWWEGQQDVEYLAISKLGE